MLFYVPGQPDKHGKDKSRPRTGYKVRHRHVRVTNILGLSNRYDTNCSIYVIDQPINRYESFTLSDSDNPCTFYAADDTANLGKGAQRFLLFWFFRCRRRRFSSGRRRIRRVHA